MDDAEADLLLATHDPLSALAEYDQAKLDALLQQVQAESPAVEDMLRSLAEEEGPDPAAEEKGVSLPAERFEVIVECDGEGQQREVFDRLTQEGLTYRVLTF